MRVFPIVVLLLLSAGPVCGAEKPIDLLRAIELALKQNKVLARSVLSTGSSMLARKRAKTAFGWKLEPGGSVGIETGEEALGVGILASRKFASGTEMVLQTGLSKNGTEDGTDPYSGRISVQINQPLFRNFGSLVNTEFILKAESAIKEKLRLLEMQKADLIVAVVEAYVDILLLERRIKAAEAAALRMKKLHKLTKMLEHQGRTTRVDSLRVELQRHQALTEIESVRERYESGMRDLAELLGENINKTFFLRPVPFIVERIPDAAEATPIALENRLDYAQILEDERDAKRNVRIRRKRIWPSLRLTMRYEHSGKGQDMDAVAALDETVWFVGLSTDTDLLRTEERVELDRALLDKNIALKNVEILKQAIAGQVQQHLSAYRRTTGQVKNYQRNFGLAGSRRDLTKKLFEMGRGDNFSVTDAENAYIESEARLLRAQADVTIAGYRLRRALGTLIEAPQELKVSTTAGKRHK